jgi:hypothetical protein
MQVRGGQPGAVTRVVQGAVGGAAATAAMSAVMLAGDKLGLMPDQPPKRIVRAALPGRKYAPKPGERVLGAVAHFGFGMASGALLRLVNSRRTPVSAGVAYGLTIWLASYQGWVPGMDILPPVSDDQPGRPFVMAAGHVVYGATLALTLNRMNGSHST